MNAQRVPRSSGGDAEVLREALESDRFAGRLRTGQSLAARTSWRVGGRADWWFEPLDANELAGLFADLPMRLPVTVLGLGSNVLIRDGGVRGLVVSLRHLRARARSGDHGLCLDGGVPCAQAARFAAREGLSGIEFFAGIPGTVGGALAMNAGAWGGETWPRVITATCVERSGVIRTLANDAFDWGYRRVDRRDTDRDTFAGVFVAAELQLEALDTPVAREQIEANIRELLRDRARRQPQGVASCGSVFRNPTGDSAGRLIEAAGLKGLRVGNAEVSRKHANFIVHDGKARAADIETLIESVRDAVLAHAGIELETEVRILGDRAESPGGAVSAMAVAATPGCDAWSLK